MKHSAMCSQKKTAKTPCLHRLSRYSWKPIPQNDLPSNNMKPRVRTSSDWFRQHVTGVLEGGPKCWAPEWPRPYFTAEEGAWVLGRWTRCRQTKKEKYEHQSQRDRKHLAERQGAEPEAVSRCGQEMQVSVRKKKWKSARSNFFWTLS